jgi:hypothetical protein
MANYPRLVFQCAAALGIAAMLSIATPAVAADIMVPASEVAAKPAPHAIRHHASYRARNTASYDDRRASHLGCSGAWCGRQFVLIVGVAY